MRKLEIYLDKRKLSLNVKKSKMMIFRKEISRKTTWRWKGEEIEMVKEFTYLVVRLQKNGDVEAHIAQVVRRTNIIIKEI